MEKRKILAAVLLLSMLMGGCGTAEDDSTAGVIEPTDTWEDNIEYEDTDTDYENDWMDDDTSVNEPKEYEPSIYALDNTYTGTAETEAGYKAEFTMSVTNWLRASDTEMLQYVWEKVGGKDAVPAVSNFHKYANDGFTNENAAVAFGTVFFRNITEGYDFTEDNPVSFNLLLASEEYDDVKGYVEYSTKSTYFSTNPNDYYKSPITPLMTYNSWGPVPVMFVFPNAFTPNNPDGAPRLNDFKINIRYSHGEGSISINLP